MMVEFTCDSKDKINWENRATILVVASVLAGTKKKELLNKIDDPDFKKIVNTAWNKFLKAKRERKCKTTFTSVNLPKKIGTK